MKKNILKKIVLGISTFYIIYFLFIILLSSFCVESWCHIREDSFFGKILFLLMSLSITFLFSLLTYKMKDEVFTAWIKFASWWVPIIIFVTYLQNTQTGGGGLGIGGALSSGFDMVVLGFFYFIFVVVSLVIIIKKYRALR